MTSVESNDDINKHLAYKELVIELENFSYLHTGINNEESSLYVGREKLIEKLVNILHESSGGRGSYLISGYRGVGKTSFIKKVIDRYKSTLKYKDRVKEVVSININLGDKSRLSPQDIYYSIANILHQNLSKVHVRSSFLVNRFNPLLYVSLFVSALIVIVVICPAMSIIFDFAGATGFVVLVYMLQGSVYRCKNNVIKELSELQELMLRLENEVIDSSSIGLVNKYLQLNNKRNVKSYVMNARVVEEKLRVIIDGLSTKKVNVVVVFDELDKLSERDIDYAGDSGKTGVSSGGDAENKVHKINNLLSDVKNFITTVHARFIFISGRETLDSFFSERDSANSLYESLFDQVFELPSLLTDGNKDRKGNASISRNVERYLCCRLGQKKNDENENEPFKSLNNYYQNNSGIINEELNREVVLALRNLIQYLSFHSWGNPKRLSSIFESFIKQASSKEVNRNQYFMVVEKDLNENAENIDKSVFIAIIKAINFNKNNNEGEDVKFWLNLSFNQQRSMAFCSGLFTLFQHQLSREVSTIGDKLTVSSLSALQFILKFHQYAFTRESLHRMSEALNIYRAPEFNVVVDDLLTHVFKPYIRRVRNGAYRYRFQSGFEQEIRYVSSISDLESASFNFSLDAMNRVKSYFENIFLNEHSCSNVRSKAAIVLGDMNAIEQSYNSAARYYAAAIHYLSFEIEAGCNHIINDLDLITSYLEAVTKYGDLEEHRQNYNKAAVFYAQASDFLRTISLPEKTCNLDAVLSGDSKWEIYKHAYWAGIFLSLKRSPVSDVNIIIHNEFKNKLYNTGSDPRYFLRLANFLFFNGSENMELAAGNYYTAAESALNNWPVKSERREYIVSAGYSGMSESILVYKSNNLLKNLTRKQVKDGNDECINCDEVRNVLIKGVVSSLNDKAFKVYDQYFHSLNGEGVGITCVSVFDKLRISAEGFLEINLYTAALIVYLKLIAYRLTMLDAFKNCKDAVDKGVTVKKIDEYFEQINAYALQAAKCISLARQIDSSQSIKTLEFRDYSNLDERNSNVDLLTQLFDMFISADKDYPSKDNAFWQHSLWGQKLASLLYWGEYVKSKIINDYESYVLPKKIQNKHFEPSKVPSLSIRASILMRWVYSRALIKERLYVDGKINEFKLRILSPSIEKNISSEWRDAYIASRNMYFILLDVSIISRKNLDLVYPTLAHIYYIQWSLLECLVRIVINNKQLMEYNKLTSFRSVCRFVQEKFTDLDYVFGGREEIAPSHFDYEYVYTKLQIHLNDIITINDETSRVRTSILQQKYFFHDDHSDQEFHMDWTLSHMFSPAAFSLRCEVKQKHSELLTMLN